MNFTTIISILLGCLAVYSNSVEVQGASNNQFSAKRVALLQVTKDGSVCIVGYHKDDDKCVSNNDWCDSYDEQYGNCKDCNFWTWTVNHDTQGTYCATHWWAVVLIILAIILGILLCCGLCGLLYMKKKASAEGSHGRYDDNHYDIPTSNEIPHYGVENQVRGEFMKQGAKNVMSNPGTYGAGNYMSGGGYNPYGGY